jgi:hypothetical protein
MDPETCAQRMGREAARSSPRTTALDEPFSAILDSDGATARV